MKNHDVATTCVHAILDAYAHTAFRDDGTGVLHAALSEDLGADRADFEGDFVMRWSEEERNYAIADCVRLCDCYSP